MISKMREKCKNKKGFTLVELIVVLVILAILIALLVPTLTGYIDKANEKKILAEAKLALNAAQVTETDSYSTESTATSSYEGGEFVVIKNSTQSNTDKDKVAELIKLGEVDTKSVVTYEYTSDKTGKITNLKFANAKYMATYDGTWSTGEVK